MKGSTFKRCTCPPKYTTLTDESGKATRKRVNCPKRHGSWSFIADVGVDEVTGNRKQIKRGGFPKQTDAQDALDKLLNQLRTDTYVPDDGMTVAAWLHQWVDERQELGKIKDTTADGYRDHIRVHLVPAIGRLKLRDLRPSHVQQLLKDLGKGERGPATVARIHATLRSALTVAVKRQLILSNPAQFVELPETQRPEVHPWEAEELGAFLDSVASHPLSILFETVAATGLRRGEVLGLRWSDLDLTERFLMVNQQVKACNKVRAGEQPECPYCGAAHGGLVFDMTPKSAGRKNKPVELDDGIVGALMLHKLAQDAEREQWGDAYRDHGLVFTRPGGDPLVPGDVSELFHHLIEAVRFDEDAHLPDAERRRLVRVRLHDLRHGHASLMLAARVPMEIVSKRLGHSSLAITADTYSHLLKNVGRGAAEQAAALVPRKQRDQSVTNPGSVTESGADTKRRAAGQRASKGAPPAGFEPATIGLEVGDHQCRDVSDDAD